MDAQDDRTTNPALLDNQDTPEGEEGNGRLFPVMLFGIVSLGFLMYLAIGSVEARIWRFGRIYFEDRSVREVWAHMGENLPNMPAQPVFTALFWVSVAALVVSTIFGLWLFLGTDDEEPVRDHGIQSGTQGTNA